MNEFSSAVIDGATGAIGIALINELIKNNIDVLVLTRKNSLRNNVIPVHPLVTVKYCSLEELSDFENDTEKEYDVFYHFAWGGTTGDSRNNMHLQNKNVEYALDAVHVAKGLGCKVFIGSGSQAEFGRVDGTITSYTPCYPENGYGMAKLCAGQMCRVECEKLGMDFIWTRILSVYGPYDGENSMISSVIKKLLSGEKPSLTSGEQMWDYIYSEDAAKALYLLAEKGISGKTYILAGGKSKKLREYVEILRDSVCKDLPLGFGEFNAVNPVSLQADISELTNDTGFVPETDFKTGIAKTIDYIKQRL